MWNVSKTHPLFANDEAPSSSSQRFDFVRPAPANRARFQVSRESFEKRNKTTQPHPVLLPIVYLT